MKKILLWVFLLLFWVPVLGAAEKEEITDIAGRNVKVPVPAQRILCKGPGALRLAVYLGIEDRVAGVEEIERKATGRPYAMAHPELASLPGIGKGGPSDINKNPDLEKTLLLSPDVLFVTYMEPSKADHLEKLLGIPVVLLSYGDLGTFDEKLYESLLLMGKICGADQRAAEVVAFFDGMKEDLLRRSASAPPISASVYVGCLGHRGAHGLESTRTDYPPLDLLHITSLPKKHLGQEGSFMVDKEQILLWNPEYIFADAGGEALLREDMRAHPSFYEGLSAFRHKRVFRLIPFNFYTTNVGTAFGDAYAMGSVLFPRAFQDIDPAEKTEEIYRFLLGSSPYHSMVSAFGSFGPLDFSQ